MRPRKLLLIYHPDERNASIQKFKLETWGYRVVVAMSREELEAIDAEAIDGTVEFEASPNPESKDALPCVHIYVPFAAIERRILGNVTGSVLREMLSIALRFKSGPRPTARPVSPESVVAREVAS